MSRRRMFADPKPVLPKAFSGVPGDIMDAFSPPDSNLARFGYSRGMFARNCERCGRRMRMVSLAATHCRNCARENFFAYLVSPK